MRLRNHIKSLLSAMPVGGFLACSHGIFVDDRDGVDAQVCIRIIHDQDLPSLPHAVMTHIVAGSALREASAVDIDPLPRAGRIILDKDTVGDAAL